MGEEEEGERASEVEVEEGEGGQLHLEDEEGRKQNLSAITAIQLGISPETVQTVLNMARPVIIVETKGI